MATKHLRQIKKDKEDYPSYGRDIVQLALDEIGVEVSDIESNGWASAFCPMHSNTNTPSFSVNMDEGAWICRAGCGSGVDLAYLISYVTGEEVKEVRHRLLSSFINDPDAINKILFKKRKRAVVDTSGESLFYHRGKIHKYLTEVRGFSLAVLLDWGVGWDVEENKIVVPIYFEGKLRGLIRRTPSDIYVGAKYDYTYGFDKDATLFGFDKAKKDLQKVIVVEGALDCIWLHMHGYNAVALLGSSLSGKQAELLKKNFKEIVFAFDNDAAGKIAESKAWTILYNVRTYSVSFPQGRKDVQQCSAIELKKMLERPRESWYNILTGVTTMSINREKEKIETNEKNTEWLNRLRDKSTSL